MSAKDRFAEFRQERESADKGHTSRSSANRPVNFGDYEKSLTRIQELLQKHELAHEFKNKNGESIFELQRCPENEQHSRGEAFVKVSSAGDVTAGCQHNSCKSLSVSGKSLSVSRKLVMLFECLCQGERGVVSLPSNIFECRCICLAKLREISERLQQVLERLSQNL